MKPVLFFVLALLMFIAAPASAQDSNTEILPQNRALFAAVTISDPLHVYSVDALAETPLIVKYQTYNPISAPDVRLFLAGEEIGRFSGTVTGGCFRLDAGSINYTLTVEFVGGDHPAIYSLEQFPGSTDEMTCQHISFYELLLNARNSNLTPTPAAPGTAGHVVYESPTCFALPDAQLVLHVEGQQIDIQANAVLPIVGITADGTQLLISIHGMLSWVASVYVSFEGNCTGIPVAVGDVTGVVIGGGDITVDVDLNLPDIAIPTVQVNIPTLLPPIIATALPEIVLTPIADPIPDTGIGIDVNVGIDDSGITVSGDIGVTVPVDVLPVLPTLAPLPISPVFPVATTLPDLLPGN